MSTRFGLPALTIHQPYASLVIAGLRPFDLRPWAAPATYRDQRIAVHAASRPVREAEIRAALFRMRQETNTAADPDTKAKQKMMALLEDYRQAPLALPIGVILGTAILGEPVLVGIQRQCGTEHWTWPLLDIEPYATPIPARGAADRAFWMWRIGADAA